MAVLAALMFCTTPAIAAGAGGFGPLTGPGGCLVGPGTQGPGAGADCGEGKALIEPKAVAVSPDGANVYVAAGTSSSTVASSFGALVILKRDPSTGAITETGCWSSDGTDGRDGASGACTPTPSLLGADGVAVSPDGLTVYVASSYSGSVVAFARDPETGSLTRLGCFQGRPPGGSPCPPANIFFGSAGVVASAENKALYVAAPAEGAISTLLAGSITASGSSVASLFGIPLNQFFTNPCVAVNGYDGSCAVGVATQGLDALALSPDRRQLYATAPGSRALDVFTLEPTGALAESGCLKVEAPPGLCASSKLMNSPTSLAITPDGRNVYVADSSPQGNGRLDVLGRDATTGELSDVSCVDFLPPETHEEKNEESKEEENQHEAVPQDSCDRAAGVSSVDVVAVSGDGSEVVFDRRRLGCYFRSGRDHGQAHRNIVRCQRRQSLHEPAVTGNRRSMERPSAPTDTRSTWSLPRATR